MRGTVVCAAQSLMYWNAMKKALINMVQPTLDTLVQSPSENDINISGFNMIFERVLSGFNGVYLFRTTT